jgi:uncharacterized protein YbjT (DUF2867 family)
MMILVTGATGNVGRNLIERLAERNIPVRAMTRRPNQANVPKGVEVIYGDMNDLSSLEAAFTGVDKAFFMTSQMPDGSNHPTHDLTLTKAASNTNVKHIVKLSVFDGGTADDPIGKWHREAENALINSGIAWTMLRPGRFMSNVLQWIPMILHGDAVTIPFANWAAVPIAPEDIAAVAEIALTTDKYHKKTFQLTGPEILTPIDELKIISEVINRNLKPIELSIETAKAGMLASGMSDVIVEAIINRVYINDPHAEVLATVSNLLDRPPMAMAEWVRKHIHLFMKA